MFNIKNKKLNLLVNLISYLIVILSIFFIILSFKKNIVFKDLKIFLNFQFLLIIIIESVIYSAVVFLYSIAYTNNLKISAGSNVDNKKIYKIYLKSNIAKYFPGNVFHFAGRHALCDNNKIFHRDLLFANILEILLLILASSLIGFPVIIKNIIYLFNLIKEKLVFLNFIIAGIFIFLLLLSLIIFYKKINFKFFKKFFKIKILILIIKSLFIYFVIFILIGILLYCLFLFISGNVFNDASLFSVIALFSVSWVVGYVVPGASGGIGIREALIIYFAAFMFSSGVPIIAAFSLRIVTTFGDIIAFAASFFIKTNNSPHQET